MTHKKVKDTYDLRLFASFALKISLPGSQAKKVVINVQFFWSKRRETVETANGLPGAATPRQGGKKLFWREVLKTI